MADTPIYYDAGGAPVLVDAQFTNASGASVGVAPTAVTLMVVDPAGGQDIFTYNPADTDPTNKIISDGNGRFHLLLDLTNISNPGATGLYSYVWTGAGGGVANGTQVFVGSFRVLPFLTATGMQKTSWYCSKEELKSRLGIDSFDDKDDYELELVMGTVTDWITRYCGRHFYQISEVRTFVPMTVWDLKIDDIVSVTSVDLDYQGDGNYDVHWVEDQDFQLVRFPGSYNVHDEGIAQPFNMLQVTSGTNSNPVGGQWLPWIVPFTRRDRVQITGVWGWEHVPWNVTQAALYIAAEMFKAKDSPFGVAGFEQIGIVKIQASPWVVELLRPYKNVRKTVGV